MATVTDLSILKINYLTQQQYDDAVSQGTINPNELYLTPASGSGVSDVMVDGVSVVLGGVAYVDLTGKQDILVSGTNIKTVNGVSLLGSGNIVTPNDDTTYTFSISGHTLTITPSTGSPTTLSLPDNNTTYSISGSGDTITLTGSDGSTSTATISDDNTTYTLSKSGNTITLTGSDGSTTSVTDANDNTTYTISISGNVLTLTPSTGTPQTITLPDDDTTYTISKSGNTITLTGSDGSTSSVTVIDGDTTYTVSISGHTLTLTGSDGSTSTATLPDDDTTYTISVSGNNLTLTPSSGTVQTITLPIPTKTSDLTNDSDFVSDANYVHTDNNFTTAEKNKLSGIEAGAEVNVQANWNQSDSTADDYIKNKPTIPTPPSPSSTTPLMDGTASVGSETNYARGDHRHPADTSKQDTLVSGTNIKTINGSSILGSGDLQVGGSVTSTDVPTADTISEFDSDAHMNSTDMTSQEVDDFVDGLNVSGGGLNIITRSYSVSAKNATYYEETINIGVSGYTPISVGWSANQINTNIYALYFVDNSTLFVGRSITTGGQLSSNTVAFTVTYISI